MVIWKQQDFLLWNWNWQKCQEKRKWDTYGATVTVVKDFQSLVKIIQAVNIFILFSPHSQALPPAPQPAAPPGSWRWRWATRLLAPDKVFRNWKHDEICVIVPAISLHYIQSKSWSKNLKLCLFVSDQYLYYCLGVFQHVHGWAEIKLLERHRKKTRKNISGQFDTRNDFSNPTNVFKIWSQSSPLWRRGGVQG